MEKLSAEHHWTVRGEATEGFRPWDQLSPAEQKDVLEHDYPLAPWIPAVMQGIPTWFYRRRVVEAEQRQERFQGYFRDYSGAFCAVACLRSSLMAAAKSLRSGRMDRARDALVESAYWAGQLYERRKSARRHRGYVAPLPDISDVPMARKGGKR